MSSKEEIRRFYEIKERLDREMCSRKEIIDLHPISVVPGTIQRRTIEDWFT